jgi:hypothetical protein
MAVESGNRVWRKTVVSAADACTDLTQVATDRSANGRNTSTFAVYSFGLTVNFAREQPLGDFGYNPISFDQRPYLGDHFCVIKSANV